MGQDLKVSFKDAKDNLLGRKRAGFQGRNPLKKWKASLYLVIFFYGSLENLSKVGEIQEDGGEQKYKINYKRPLW